VHSHSLLVSAVFPDLQGNQNLRSYHASDIPLDFGTYNASTLTAGPTANEIALSHYMQSAWVAFAEDPANALNNPPFSWPQVNSRGNNIVLLGNSGNQTGATFTTSSSIDSDCDIISVLVGLYNALGIDISLF
jgi:carboxylesterase type B